MATATRLSPLKRLCAQSGRSRDDLAVTLGVAVSKVAQWERSLDGASPIELRDLAFVLDVTVEALLGTEARLEDVAKGIFSGVTDSRDAYGTLKLNLVHGESTYPVSQSAREQILKQIQRFDIQEDSHQDSWLHVSTLDNRYLYANPRYLNGLELVSDDAVEMPTYEHPEVYSALEDWELEDETLVGPAIRRRCLKLMSRPDAGELLRRMQYARVVSASGAVSWHFLIEDDDTLGYFLLDIAQGCDIARNRFLRVMTEGYHRERFVNLSNVALVEVPSNRYLRLSSREA